LISAEDPRMASQTNMDSSQLPYNTKNRLLMKPDVIDLISRYNPSVVDIQDLNLYRKAFVHKSYCTRKNENFLNGNTLCPENCLPLQEESNERLEFLGDAVLNLIVAKYLFTRYEDENEGFLTKLRTKLVNGNSLAIFAKAMNLQKHIMISSQIEENDGRCNKKILEDCFEAFLGALFIDFENQGRIGFQTCEKWLTGFFEETIDFSELISTNQNYKDVLLKYFQHTFNEIPRFYEVSTEMVNNSKVFTICIKKDGKSISVGKGSSKKEAENDAAKQAMVYFGI
jgi:ribonuclease III